MIEAKHNHNGATIFHKLSEEQQKDITETARAGVAAFNAQDLGGWMDYEYADQVCCYTYDRETGAPERLAILSSTGSFKGAAHEFALYLMAWDADLGEYLDTHSEFSTDPQFLAQKAARAFGFPALPEAAVSMFAQHVREDFAAVSNGWIMDSECAGLSGCPALLFSRGAFTFYAAKLGDGAGFEVGAMNEHQHLQGGIHQEAQNAASFAAEAFGLPPVPANLVAALESVGA